jgi:hypothetical protein
VQIVSGSLKVDITILSIDLRQDFEASVLLSNATLPLSAEMLIHTDERLDDRYKERAQGEE